MQVTRAAGYGKSGRVSNVMSNRKLRRRQHLLRLQPSNLAVIECSRSVRWRIAADQLFRGITDTRPKESIASPKWSPESRHPSVAIGFSGTMLGRSASHGCIYEAWASALTTFATLDVRMTSSSLPSRRGPGTPRLGGPLHKPSRMLLLLIRGLTSRSEHQNDPPSWHAGCCSFFGRRVDLGAAGGGHRRFWPDTGAAWRRADAGAVQCAAICVRRRCAHRGPGRQRRAASPAAPG